MTSNPGIDRMIQVSQNDIDFWTQQLAEHALFMTNLINPQIAPDLVEEAKMLYTGWYEHLQNKPVKYNPVFSNSQYALLETAHNRISQGLPINKDISQDDFHDLLRHMILEQTFFVRLVQNRMTIKNE